MGGGVYLFGDAHIFSKCLYWGAAVYGNYHVGLRGSALTEVQGF